MPPNNDDLIELLQSIGDNASNLRSLVEQVRSAAGVTAFVGAGMSAPFGLKTWRDFLLDQAPTDKVRKTLENDLRDGLYEEAAEELLRVRGVNAFQSQVDDAFGPHRLADKPLAGAVTYLPRLANGPVLTTNFDSVLEKVFDHANAPFDDRIIGMKLDQIRDALHRKRHVLIKLHGDATDRVDRVLTLSDYQRNYGDGVDPQRHPLQTVLEFVMQAPLLFLGCSLKQDRTVRVLEVLAKDKKALLTHYAVLEQPTTDEALSQRQRDLTELGVRPIWYPPTRHDMIEPLLAYLVGQAEAGAAARAARQQRPRPLVSPGLPRPPKTWVGRAAKEKEVVEALQNSNVVIIEGPRGCGKTALGLRSVNHFVDGGPFGAVVWTSAKARSLSISDILDEISLTLDFPHTIQLPMPKKETVLLEELRRSGVPCLIVIDNFETITDLAISEFVSVRLPGNCVALITSSKHVLIGGDGVKVILLKEFAEDDAKTLFRKRVSDSGLDEVSDAAFHAFFEIAGGSPLAIELVVGQMRGEQAKELDWIVEELHAGTGEVVDNLILQAWIDLPENARIVLCALSLFVTDAVEKALAETCGLPTMEFRDGIGKLKLSYILKRVDLHGADAPGVVEAGSRYAIHPLTREFARQRLSELGIEERLSRRAAAYYVNLVAEHGGSPDKEDATDLRILYTERTNILAFFEASFARHDDAGFLAFADSLSRWLFISGLWEVLGVWSEKVAMVAASENLHAGGRMLGEWGRVRSYRGEYEAAEKTFARAIELCRAANDHAGVGYVLHHQGESKIRQLAFDEAEQLLAKSLEQFKVLNRARDCIGVNYRLAELAYRRGEYEKARAMFAQGLRATQEAKWERLESYHRNFLGDLALRKELGEDLGEARRQYERALQLVPQTDTRRLAFLEYSLGQLDQRENNISRALEYAAKAQAHFSKLGMAEEAEDADRLVAKLKTVT